MNLLKSKHKDNIQIKKKMDVQTLELIENNKEVCLQIGLKYINLKA